MPTARTWNWQQKDWPEFRYNSANPFPNEVPNLIPPTDSRLRQLAVAAASHAHLSTRNEIYPPNFPLALAHTRNALSGDELTIAEIDRRLHARLPHCPVLPPRPQLDVLLTDALELLWDPLAAQGEGAYKSPHKESLTVSLTLGSRHLTRYPVHPSTLTDPAILEADHLENRLLLSAKEGGYLILTVEPSQYARLTPTWLRNEHRAAAL